ncbi:MAG: PstS family phosphate ABC transporter substrate-binding protein [Armatimonadetes bacterium]|nr:PstS family phosphate ABC transporter substrate-binding protein [Armatimonadota bacterium]
MKSALVKRFGLTSLLVGVAVLGGCAPKPVEEPAAPTAPGAPKAPVSDLKGEIKIDGSSTVFPISQAVAEEFGKANPGVKVAVGTSGTGGGMKKFTAAEIDICDASRAIKDKEAAGAAEKKIEFVELPIAFDGIAIVINKDNSYVDKLTVAELKKMWEPDSKVKTWKDVRGSFPADPIKLYGPGTDSGTFEYFTEAIVGKAKASRSDYTPSEDDNVLVKGVEGDKGALGYFGYAYYEQNKDKLKLVPVEADGKTVTPSAETIRDASYKPLSRPLFIYIAKSAIERPEVAAFVKFYLDNAATIIPKVGYVPLPDATIAIVRQRAEAKKTGSVFMGVKGVKLEDVLAKEGGAAAPAGAPGEAKK